MKKVKRISVYILIWSKIRYWQRIMKVSDTELAKYMLVGVRTLRDYDRDAKHITLEKIDNFLYVTNMDINELLSL